MQERFQENGETLECYPIAPSALATIPPQVRASIPVRFQHDAKALELVSSLVEARDGIALAELVGEMRRIDLNLTVSNDNRVNIVYAPVTHQYYITETKPDNSGACSSGDTYYSVEVNGDKNNVYFSAGNTGSWLGLLAVLGLSVLMIAIATNPPRR
jgi:hypothetical protein